MDFPHHQEEEEDDEKAVVEVVEEEEAGSWAKTKLSLLVLCCVVLCVFVLSAGVFFVLFLVGTREARLSLFAVFDVIPQFAKLRVCRDTKYLYFQNASLIKILPTLDKNGNLLGNFCKLRVCRDT